jgi:23S rRNA (guanosine2251-2'-O)-methyltransferase
MAGAPKQPRDGRFRSRDGGERRGRPGPGGHGSRGPGGPGRGGSGQRAPGPGGARPRGPGPGGQGRSFEDTDGRPFGQPPGFRPDGPPSGGYRGGPESGYRGGQGGGNRGGGGQGGYRGGPGAGPRGGPGAGQRGGYGGQRGGYGGQRGGYGGQRGGPDRGARPGPGFGGDPASRAEPRRPFPGSDEPGTAEGRGRPPTPGEFRPRPRFSGPPARGPRPYGPPGGAGFVRRGSPPARHAADAPPLDEGEELVAGRRPVEEAFAAGRPARRLLVTPARRQALERIVLHATTLRIPIVEVEGGSLTQLAGFDGHQGVAVVVEARRFASLDDLLARAIERNEPALVLVLDSLEDPQNVGTLLRSAEAVGAHGVVFPTQRQAPLSPAAVKASAGATEHLLLVPVEDLAATLTDLRLRGLRIVGSDAEAPLTAREADLRGPLALVIGSEGHGLSPAIRRRCDLFVRLPMRGAIGSLNAAVAGSILLFEVIGQRGQAGGDSPAGKPEPATTRRPGTTRSKASTTDTAPQEPAPRKAAAAKSARATADRPAKTTAAKLAKTTAAKPAKTTAAKPAKATAAKPAKTTAGKSANATAVRPAKARKGAADPSRGTAEASETQPGDPSDLLPP